MRLKKLVKEAYKTAIAKEYLENTFAEEVAMVHSELSEALHIYRQGLSVSKIFYSTSKPWGAPIELADVVIRVASMCGAFGIDLDKAVKEKMKYNKKRPYRHGGKKL